MTFATPEEIVDYALRVLSEVAGDAYVAIDVDERTVAHLIVREKQVVAAFGTTTEAHAQVISRRGGAEVAMSRMLLKAIQENGLTVDNIHVLTARTRTESMRRRCNRMIGERIASWIVSGSELDDGLGGLFASE